MSDPRGGAADANPDGDEPHDLPLAEEANGEEARQTSDKEAVPVSDGTAALGGDMTPDAEPESDDGDGGVGSPDQEEPNAGGERAAPVAAAEEREGIVGGVKVETNGEDAISHDADGEEDEDDDGDEEDDDDDDDSTPDASPRAEVKVEGESSTGMAQSGASHRVEAEAEPDPYLDGDDSGTEEEQAAFMVELERFHREQSLEFKPPKFYGKGLNCLKCASFYSSRSLSYASSTSCRLNVLAVCSLSWNPGYGDRSPTSEATSRYGRFPYHAQTLNALDTTE